MTQHRQAYVYAAATILFWSTVASAFKLTLEHLDPYQMLFYATVVSVAVLFAILVAQGKLGLLRTFTAKQWAWSVGLGLVNPCIYYIVLFQAYSLLPAQEAQPLNMIWPLVVVLLSVPLLKQRIGWISIAAVAVSFVGVLVISTHGDILGFQFNSPRGTLLATGSALLWSLFWIANVKDKRDEVAKLFASFAAGFVFVAIATVLFSDLRVGVNEGLLGAAYVGVFEMGVTFVTWAKALSLAKTTAHVSHLIYLVPFISLIFISLVVGERILPTTIVGLLLVVGGILVRGLDRTKQAPAVDSPRAGG